MDITHIIDGLNDPQRAAVSAPLGNSLVVAGAGSGKTRVVTTRIAKLLMDDVSPQNIVWVTFTNKAAREMRDRLVSLVGTDRARGISLSTFHAYCIRLLREHGQQVGLKSFFAIADVADQVSQLVASAGSSREIFKAYPPRQILGQISLFKNISTDIL